MLRDKIPKTKKVMRIWMRGGEERFWGRDMEVLMKEYISKSKLTGKKVKPTGGEALAFLRGVDYRIRTGLPQVQKFAGLRPWPGP